MFVYLLEQAQVMETRAITITPTTAAPDVVLLTRMTTFIPESEIACVRNNVYYKLGKGLLS